MKTAEIKETTTNKTAEIKENASERSAEFKGNAEKTLSLIHIFGIGPNNPLDIFGKGGAERLIIYPIRCV